MQADGPGYYQIEAYTVLVVRRSWLNAPTWHTACVALPLEYLPPPPSLFPPFRVAHAYPCAAGWQDTARLDQLQRPIAISMSPVAIVGITILQEVEMPTLDPPQVSCTALLRSALLSVAAGLRRCCCPARLPRTPPRRPQARGAPPACTPALPPARPHARTHAHRHDCLLRARRTFSART
jgi:hypothetical protein